MQLRLLIPRVSLGFLLTGGIAHAADGIWVNNNNGNWSQANNWFANTFANGASFTADFSTINISSDRTVVLDTTSRTIGNLAFADTAFVSSNWILAQSGGAILTLQTASGTPNIRVVNQTATISLELAGTQGFTKTGAGTLNLTGVNSYSGTTTVNTGILTLGSGGSLISGSALAFTNAATFNFSGAAAATQAFNGGLNATTGLGTVNNTVAGTTLTFGNITRGSGMVDFNTTTGDINTTTSNTNGMIGTWAFRGTGAALDYAVANGGSSPISSLGAATTLPTNTGSATANYTLAGAQTQIGNTAGNTLRYTGGASTLALGSTSLNLSGLMQAGTGTLTITGTVGSPGLVTSGTLDIASNTQSTTISAVVSGNGSLIYGGPSAGVLTLSGTNTYTGSTTVNSGTLVATLTNGGVNSNIGASSNAASNIVLMGGSNLTLPTGTGTVSTDRLFSVGGGGIIGINNFSGRPTLNFTSTGPIGFIDSGSSNTLTLGSTTTSVIFAPQIVDNGSGKTGVIIGANGSGVTLLNNTNSYTGVTTLNHSSGAVLNVAKLTNGGVTSIAISTTAGSNSATLSSTTGLVNGVTYAVSNPNVAPGSTFVYTGSASVTLSNNALTTASSSASTIGQPGPLGIATNAGANWAFAASGAINYTGSGDTTDHNWVITNNNPTTVTFSSNGTGPLIMTGAATSYSFPTHAKTLTLNGSNTDANSYGGLISELGGSGKVSVAKSGTGIWVLTGNNTYTGTTTVSGGTMLINGNQTAANGAISVSSGATLGGKGILGGAVTVSGGGHLAPGNSPDHLTVNNNVIFSGTASLDIELGGTNVGDGSTGYDQLELTGASSVLSLSGSNNFQLSLINGFIPGNGDQFTIALVQGTASDNSLTPFATINGSSPTGSLAQGGIFTLSGIQYQISYRAEGSMFDAGIGAGNNIMLQVIPEPASWGMVLAGFAMLLCFQRAQRGGGK